LVSDVLAAVEAALTEHFAHRPQRASVSFVGVEPIEVLRFEPVPDERAYVSLGMSRHPMTGAAELGQASDGPRAELMLRVYDPTDDYADVWRKVAVLAAAPAVEGVVHTPGMSIDLGEPLAGGSACTGVLITESPLADIATDAGAVAVRQVVPATPTELAWCRVRGSAALRDRWTSAGTDLLDLARRAVALDG
jgi:Suppressor of fused protein (SUFU)